MSNLSRYVASQPSVAEPELTPYGWSGLPFSDQKCYFPIHSFQELYEKKTPDPGGDRNTWKNFEHYAYRTLPTSGSYGHFFLIGDSVFGIYELANLGQVGAPYAMYNGWYDDGNGAALSGLTSWCDRSKGTGFIPLPANFNDSVKQTLRGMLPTIRAELSLINSVYELKDFKTLPRTLNMAQHFLGYGKGVLKNIFKCSYQHFRQVVHSGSHTVADSYLQAQFNLLPLLSDINGIYAALAKYEKRINALITREHSMQRRHFTFNYREFCDVSDNDTRIIAPFWIQNDPTRRFFCDVMTRRRVTYDDTVFHAMIEYSYNYTQYQREHAHVLGLLDYFGVNLNPAIIWNALPWSFVVDWLVGVSRWLSDKQTHNMEPQVAISRYLCSVKRRRRILVENRVIAPIGWGERAFPITNWIPLPVIDETAYRRFVFIPDIDSITSSGLSQKELSLGAALVIAQRRRRTR